MNGAIHFSIFYRRMFIEGAKFLIGLLANLTILLSSSGCQYNADVSRLSRSAYLIESRPVR